jgi:hypothetical protein
MATKVAVKGIDVKMDNPETPPVCAMREANGKEVFDLPFSLSCANLRNRHVHLLCQFRYEAPDGSFAGTGGLSRMLFA